MMQPVQFILLDPISGHRRRVGYLIRHAGKLIYVHSQRNARTNSWVRIYNCPMGINADVFDFLVRYGVEFIAIETYSGERYIAFVQTFKDEAIRENLSGADEQLFLPEPHWMRPAGTINFGPFDTEDEMIIEQEGLSEMCPTKLETT